MISKKLLAITSCITVVAGTIVTAPTAFAGVAPPCTDITRIDADCVFQVPDGVTKLGVTAAGGGGGNIASFNGGRGAIASGELAVTPGDELLILVGGKGSDASTGAGGAGGGNGGGAGGSGNCYTRGGGAGGGGATSIERDSSLLVVAGGGSGAASGRNGANAGQNANGDGSDGVPIPAPSNKFGTGGKGGTLSAGGDGGPGAVADSAGDGTDGTSGVGGDGGSDAVSSPESCAGSGGGGGYFGGGGGGSSVENWAGGVGGSGSTHISSDINPKAINTNAQVEAGWASLYVIQPTPPVPPVPPTPPNPGPKTPQRVKVSGGPAAAKHVVSWKKSVHATAATKYVLRVYQPRSVKKVIISRSTKRLSSTFTRKQLLRAWKKSRSLRGETTGIVSFRVTITAQTGSKKSKPAVTRIRVKA